MGHKRTQFGRVGYLRQLRNSGKPFWPSLYMFGKEAKYVSRRLQLRNAMRIMRVVPLRRIQRKTNQGTHIISIRASMVKNKLNKFCQLQGFNRLSN